VSGNLTEPVVLEQRECLLWLIFHVNIHVSDSLLVTATDIDVGCRYLVCLVLSLSKFVGSCAPHERDPNPNVVSGRFLLWKSCEPRLPLHSIIITDDHLNCDTSLSPSSDSFSTATLQHQHTLKSVTMGVWDAFTGRKAQPSDAPSNSSASQTIQDPAAGVSFNNMSSEDVGSFMTTPGAFDASALHPLAGLGQDTLDYLNLDDSALSDLPNSNSFLPSRGWSDDLCYGAGVAYLGALSMGGVWGLAEGLNRLPASAPPKLRLNSVLNAVTRRGPFLGNSAGVVAMMYNGFNSTIGYYRGKHDALNSVAAGGISGMIFKSSRGLRPAMVSGGIVAGLAGTWAVSSGMMNVRDQKRRY
jgi:import inner membrane translocase subunit TIM23